MGNASPSRNRYSRCNKCLYGLILIFLLVGCTTLKKAAILGGVAATSAGVASAVLSPVSTAAVVAATVTATALATELQTKGEPIEMECAPDNLWTMLGTLIESGAMWIGICALALMLIGWILPGPLQFKRKKNGNV